VDGLSRFGALKCGLGTDGCAAARVRVASVQGKSRESGQSGGPREGETGSGSLKQRR
jgi:hypothetical protein